ncbi:unnamed protein product [Cuscuta epithymum]|uniref:PROP1-like PPR domain-containing protein n=1 Tax=Cuscuta epithymum TaxID=186058 RepID=A0AAV0DVL4_9ASTE|nr:unnamed protein product [Cuscuta epithymum]
MLSSESKRLPFLLRFAASQYSANQTIQRQTILRKHCLASSHPALNRLIHSSSSLSAVSSSEPLSAFVPENSETCFADDSNGCDYDDVDSILTYSPNFKATNGGKSLENVLDVPWISNISLRNASLCTKEPSRERTQKQMYKFSQKTHLECLTDLCAKKLGLEDSDLVSSSESRRTNDEKSMENVLSAPSILHDDVSLCLKEVSRERRIKWDNKSSQKAHLDGLVDLSAKKIEVENPGSVNSSEPHMTNVVGELRNSSISHDNTALCRKKVSLERKHNWNCKSNQNTYLDFLIDLCAKQMGTDATILVLDKLRQETGLKEYNRIISLCVEEARKRSTLEESFYQLSKAYTYLNAIKERGFQFEEESYGPILTFLIDFGMVPEFHFFSEIISDGNTGSLPKLAYYETLLWIRMDNQDKIDEILNSLSLHGGEDKYAFQENYLLALCHSDRKHECLRLLQNIDITRVSSLKTLSSIFSSLGKLILEPFAEKWFLDLKTTDIGEENISSFIYDYATSIPNLMVEDVVLKFKNLHTRLDVALSSSPCEKLIKLSCKSLKVHTALNIVDHMIDGGLSLTTRTVNVILDACEGSFEYNLVRRMHSIISSNDLKPNNETFWKLINLCVKLKDFDRAYQIIKDLGKSNLLPTVNMYNAIMAGHFRQNNFHGGLMVLKQMEDANVKPDSQTFSYLINNCKSEDNLNKFFNVMKHSEVQVTKHVCMALINAYAACGQFKKAKQVISDGRVPIKSLNELKSVLVSALASHGQVSDALDIYEEIKQANCNLAPKAVISLIEHLRSEGNLDILLHLLGELDDLDYWVEAAFRIISYCIRHKHFRPVIDLLKKLKDIYCNDNVAVEVLFDEIFFLLAEKQPTDLEFGWNMLQAVKNELGVLPSRKGLDFLLSACLSSNGSPICFKIWEEYPKAGLPYNTLNYLRMYQVLLASGLLKPAAQILSNISNEDPHVWCVINACQTVYRNSSQSRNIETFDK